MDCDNAAQAMNWEYFNDGHNASARIGDVLRLYVGWTAGTDGLCYFAEVQNSSGGVIERHDDIPTPDQASDIAEATARRILRDALAVLEETRG